MTCKVSGVTGTSADVSVDGGSNDEMHIIVVDDGTINGTKDEVLEVFEGVSKA